MTATGPAHDWDNSYLGAAPPLDIGRPQPSFSASPPPACLPEPSSTRAAAPASTRSWPPPRRGRSASIPPRGVGIARRKAAERGVETIFQVLDTLRLDSLGETFKTILDSGLFHVFDDSARSRYVAALHAVLRPGGHLHLMCFSDRQPGDRGPRRVTEGELRVGSGSGWRIDSLISDRFDINPDVGTPHAEAWLADILRLPPR